MKCWSITQMEESLINRDQSELMKHIETCTSCSAIYEELLQEQIDWSSALFTESLPSSFTNQVMEALHEAHIEVPLDRVQENMNSSRKPARRKHKSMQRWTVAAAVLLLLCGSLIYSIPSIAEIVRSMFVSDAILDPGLLQSKELGLIQDPDINVSDSGYRIQVNEVSADEARLTIALKVTDRLGNAVLNGFNPEQILVKDEEGNVIGELKSPLGTNDRVDILTYIYKGELAASTITVESHIDKIKQTNGEWKFSFPVDLSKADSLTKKYELNERYVSPDGFIIQIDKLTHTPSGVKLELTTSLSGQIREKVPAELEEKQTLMFHFEDEAGEIVSQVNETNSVSMLAGETSTRTDKGIHWVYTFVDLPFDTHQIKLVLDGYSIPEKSNGSIVIYPSSLSKEKTIFRNSGDTIWLKSFTISKEADLNSSKSSGVFEIESKYVNMINPLIEQWTVVDDKGKKYSLDFRGSIDLDNKIQNGKFIIKGLSSIPTKLILSRSIIDRYYNNTDWSIDLPKGKRIPGLKNNVPQKYWR
ncbi:hypothetical protein D3C75_446380 [compost metagenome]